MEFSQQNNIDTMQNKLHLESRLIHNSKSWPDVIDIDYVALPATIAQSFVRKRRDSISENLRIKISAANLVTAEHEYTLLSKQGVGKNTHFVRSSLAFFDALVLSAINTFAHHHRLPPSFTITVNDIVQVLELSGSGNDYNNIKSSLDYLNSLYVDVVDVTEKSKSKASVVSGKEVVGKSRFLTIAPDSKKNSYTFTASAAYSDFFAENTNTFVTSLCVKTAKALYASRNKILQLVYLQYASHSNESGNFNYRASNLAKKLDLISEDQRNCKKLISDVISKIRAAFQIVMKLAAVETKTETYEPNKLRRYVDYKLDAKYRSESIQFALTRKYSVIKLFKSLVRERNEDGIFATYKSMKLAALSKYIIKQFTRPAVLT